MLRYLKKSKKEQKKLDIFHCQRYYMYFTGSKLAQNYWNLHDLWHVKRFSWIFSCKYGQFATWLHARALEMRFKAIRSCELVVNNIYPLLLGLKLRVGGPISNLVQNFSHPTHATNHLMLHIKKNVQRSKKRIFHSNYYDMYFIGTRFLPNYWNIHNLLRVKRFFWKFARKDGNFPIHCLREL